MHLKNRVTEDSPIDPQETKELIERLSDPSFHVASGQATVKDLAETLDMDPDRVIAGLQQLREERELQLSPQLGESREFGLNLQRNRMATVMIFCTLGIMAICFYFLLQQPSIAPPTPAPTQTAPSAQVAPEPPK